MIPATASPRSTAQRGAVLFIALIMLILVTLLALAAMRLATTNLQLVNNQQFRAEADAAANYALGQAMNSSTFLANTTDTTTQVSLAQDDPSTDAKALQVTVKAPKCKRYGYIPKSKLVVGNTVKAEDAVCFTGQSSSGVVIVTPGMGNLNDNSLCADALFDVQAIVTDNATGATTTHAIGISARMDYTDAENKCK